MTAGELVVVATPIGNLGDLSPRAAEVLAGADIVCCEDTRHTGLMLSRLNIKANRLVSLHAHNERERSPQILAELRAGAQIAVVSDAGTPGVSDPGARLVMAAVEAGFKVTTVPGPSAVLAALAVAGVAWSRWRFEGFLPRKGPERRARVAEIARAGHPVVLYESPRRLTSTLSDLAAACGGDRGVSVCRELTKIHEEVLRTTLGQAGEHFRATEPRGEITLVVHPGAGAGENAPPEDAAVRLEVEALVAAGHSRRDAVSSVASRLGLSRRHVYDASLVRGPKGGGAPR